MKELIKFKEALNNCADAVDKVIEATKREEMVKYEIKKEIGVISESTTGWRKELNMISWNDKEAKYDLREWAPEHEKMSKGITLTKEELISLREILNKMEL